MITDDWSTSVSSDWDTIEADFDWRFSGFQAKEHAKLKVLSEEDPIDIEGEYTTKPGCCSYSAVHYSHFLAKS